MKESTSKAVSKPINSGKSKKAVNSTGVKKGKSSSNPNPVITTAKVTRTSPCRSATSATTDTESSASELMHMALPLPCEERICEEVNFVDIGDDLLQWLTTDWLTDFDRPSSLLVHPTHSTVVHTTPTSSSTSTDSGKERMVFVMGIATDFLTPAYWTKPVDY